MIFYIVPQNEVFNNLIYRGTNRYLRYKIGENNNMPSVIPQVRPGEGRMYTDLTTTTYIKV